MERAPAKVISTSAIQPAAGRGGHLWILAGGLRSPEVTVGPVNGDQGCSGHAQGLWCPEVALWDGRDLVGCPEHTGTDSIQAWGAKRCLMGFPGQTDSMWNSILGWAVWCCHEAGSNFNAKNPWDMRVILKFQDSFSDSTTLIHQFNPYTAWTHPTGTPSFKKTKLISSQYFAFNSQLLLSRLQGYSSLTLSPARDFLLWFLDKPAMEISD